MGGCVDGCENAQQIHQKFDGDICAASCDLLHAFLIDVNNIICGQHDVLCGRASYERDRIAHVSKDLNSRACMHVLYFYGLLLH